MKKFLILVPLLFAVVLLNGQTKNFIDQPYIEVTGSADSLVTPDEIYIRFNISEKWPTKLRFRISLLRKYTSTLPLV